jgi:hypothetical protein
MAMLGGGPGDEAMDDVTLDRNWRLAVRVATVSAGLGAALAGALHVFVGLGAGLLVATTSAGALLIGSLLPPALPVRSQPVTDEAATGRRFR